MGLFYSFLKSQLALQNSDGNTHRWVNLRFSAEIAVQLGNSTKYVRG